MHRQAVARPRTRQRTATLFGTVLFLVLAASGTAHAVWSTLALATTGSVASGSVSITQSGSDQLKFDYASAALVTTKPITVTNGAVPSTYTLVLSAPTSTLAGAITVNTWPVAAVGNCTAGTALPGTQTVRTWATGTTLTGPLAASASIVYCVRTSMSAAAVSANTGSQITAKLDLSALVGTNWKTATTSVTVAQAVPDTTAPTAPTNLNATSTTDAAATLTWTAATDTVGVTSYRVYRDNVLVGSGITGLTFTDTGLNVGTTYSYTVEALDAAGNVSARSIAELAATSPIPSPTTWYRVRNAGLCLTGSATANAAVTMQACVDALATQLWQYDQVNQNAFLNSKANANLALQRNSNSSVVVGPRTTSLSQQWTSPLPTDGLYEFRVTPQGGRTECLQAASAGVALKTQTCTSGTTQEFTLTGVAG